MKNADKIINEFIERCKNGFGKNLISIVLFGSRPRGLATSMSDYDFLVVLKKLSQRESEITRKIRMSLIFDYGKSIDIVLMTKRDAIDNFRALSPLFAGFVLGNKVLYGEEFIKPLFMDMVKKISRTNIKYCEGGKIWNLQKTSLRILQ